MGHSFCPCPMTCVFGARPCRRVQLTRVNGAWVHHPCPSDTCRSSTPANRARYTGIQGRIRCIPHTCLSHVQSVPRAGAVAPTAWTRCHGFLKFVVFLHCFPLDLLFAFCTQWVTWFAPLSKSRGDQQLSFLLDSPRSFDSAHGALLVRPPDCCNCNALRGHERTCRTGLGSTRDPPAPRAWSFWSLPFLSALDQL